MRQSSRLAFALLVCVSGPTAAQVTIPGSLEPGQIQRQLEQPRPVRPAPERVLPAPPRQPVPPGAGELRFVLRSLTVEGATVYRADELVKPFLPLIGKEISVAQVFDIANQMTARYRNDGYVLSQVLVPAQNIQEGAVRLLAVEGYVDSVRFQGASSFEDQALAPYAERIRASRPLRAEILERYLLLMNDLGGASAHATLIPSEKVTGAADLVVELARTRSRVNLGVHNRNSKSLGPWRGTVDWDFSGAIASWDQITARGGTSFNSEINYEGLGYALPIGAEGGRLGAAYTLVDAKPGPAANFSLTGLRTRSSSGSVLYSYPWIRSRTHNLYLRGAFTTFDGTTTFEGADISADRIRALRIGAAYDFTDRFLGVNLVDLEVAQGLKGLGAREQGTSASPLSRINGNADFTKANLYAARVQGLGGPWSLLGALTAQHAFSNLLAPEQFAFGGEPFGRAYDAAELLGDFGRAAKLELRYSSALPRVGIPGYTAYAFYDWGEVRRRDPINQSSRERAAARGIGVRFNALRRLGAFAEIADPINRDVGALGHRRPRFFAGIQLSL